jgi:NitT/TauT family transport system permease protein
VKNLRQIGAQWGVLPVATFLAAWEVIARLDLVPGELFLPPFSTVVRELIHLSGEGILMDSLLRSSVRVLIGFCTGAVAGIAIGTVMGWNETVRRAFHPVASLLYPIPALGWLPLLMIWVGIGEMLPILIIFICSFFPILYNTVTGIRGVSRDFIKAAKTLGASDIRILSTVLLPIALPNIFTGLRLEAGMAWRVIIAAEMVAIPTGIGALMMKAESLMRLDIIIVCLMILSVVCFSIEKLFLYIEHRLTKDWR